MKQSPLRRTGFKSKTPPKELKRVPLKSKKTLTASTPLRPKTPWRPQKKPLKPRSEKMQRIYTEERIPLVKELLAKYPNCQARVVRVCKGRSVDVHEVKSRGRGGSITDRDNCLAVCRACHDWIGSNPQEAQEMGLLKHGWE